MNKSIVTPVIYLAILMFSGCESKQDIDCGYNGATIQVLNDQDAAVRKSDTQYFLYFENGIIIDSPTLLDTIYLLLPCNLPAKYKFDSQQVIISGDIKENPGFSSHNNYTDFYIDKISGY